MFKERTGSPFKLGLAALVLTATMPLSAAAQMDMSARERVLDYIARQDPTAAPIAVDAIAAVSPEVEAPVPSSESLKPDGPITTNIDLPLINTAPDVLGVSGVMAETINEPLFESEIIATAPQPAEDLPEMPEIISTTPRITSDNGLSEAERESSIVRDLSSLNTSRASSGPTSFGFFTSARDYLAQRGQTPQPRLTLRYDITRKNAKTAVPGPSSIVDIIIGTDYAAISKSPESLVIYDFKEKRLLNLSITTDSFTNASLYAAAYRSLDTVNKMTNGGKQRSLALGGAVTLDSFYLESALGYAAMPAPADLKIQQLPKKITADLGEKRVFSAMLEGPKLDDFRQAYSFIGLLYHSEPVHPAILADLIEMRSAPNSMTFHSFGPKIPDGEIISWTLKSKMAETAGFPLPASAKSALQVESVSPLAYVMSEAIAGRALGGRVEPRSALTVINQQITQGDPLSAWVSAQSLKDSLGGCEQLSGLCKAISKAESQKSSSRELAVLIDALAQIKNKSTRIAGLSALKPMITAADAPSVVLRRAGLALAKTAKADRDAAGLADIDPAELLSQAIARNPYDFLAYQGLAQLMAARGDFIQSWDINDALRAFSDVPARLRRPIDKAESQLASRAPGFFPPVDG